jgi:hypothetical protein
MIQRTTGDVSLAIAVGLTLGFFVVESNEQELRPLEQFAGSNGYAARTGRFFPGV